MATRRDSAAARDMLTPAMTNPETANDAQTWYVAGTIEYGDYDNLLGKKAVGQNADGQIMGNDLLLGYDYFMKALPLDSIVESGLVMAGFSMSRAAAKSALKPLAFPSTSFTRLFWADAESAATRHRPKILNFFIFNDVWLLVDF